MYRLALLTIIFTQAVVASNTQFQNGDSFFYGSLNTKADKKVTIKYEVDSVYEMLCGYSGVDYLEIICKNEDITLFFDWCLKKNNKYHRFIILNKDYDINKNPIFLRYNETSKSDTHGGGVFIEDKDLTLINKKNSDKIKGLNTSSPIQVKKIKKIEGEVFTLEESKVITSSSNIDIYFFAHDLNFDKEMERFKQSPKGKKPKCSKYFSNYAKGKKGLKLYKWHNNSLTEIIHNGNQWVQTKSISVRQ